MWGHFVVGFVSLFVYLSQIDFTHLAYWRRGASTLLILRGAPVLLPYVASATTCWRMYTWQGRGPGRLRVLAFMSLLVAGAAFVDAVLLGYFGQVENLLVFEMLLLQGAGYVWGGSWILDVI